MRLRTYGALLDVALLATTGYLLSSSPLVTHLRSAPGGALAGLRTLADGAPYARSLSGAAVAGGEAPSSTKWADFLLGDNLGALASSSRSGDPARFHELDGWLNSWVLPEAVRASLPHVLAIWLRNCLAGWALYFIVGGMWAAVIYGPWRARFFGSGGGPPPWDDMMLQVQVSTQAMLLYSLMPTLGEWLMERGWTHAYLDWPQMEPLSIARYLGGIAAYVFLVVSGELGRVGGGGEGGGGGDGQRPHLRISTHTRSPLTFSPLPLAQEWGIYWMHRYLHDNRFLYKLLHRTHHIYNNNLSPFAGLAFHPIDGMLQVRVQGGGGGVGDSCAMGGCPWESVT